MATNIAHPYIEEKQGVGRGRFIIKGTRTRVKNLVAYYKLGYTPDELAREFPHLSLSKIYDALSFYHDHVEEIDKEIEEESEEHLKKTEK